MMVINTTRLIELWAVAWQLANAEPPARALDRTLERAVQAMTCNALDVAIVGDGSRSMQGHSGVAIEQIIDSVASILTKCGGRILFTAVGVNPSQRIVSTAFTSESTGGIESDTIADPYAAREVRRQAQRRLDQNSARLRSFHQDATALARRIAPRRGSTSSVCAALTDVAQFLEGRAEHRKSVLILATDLEATDDRRRCPRTAVADLVIQIADSGDGAVSVQPPARRMFSAPEVFLAVKTFIEDSRHAP